MLAFAPVCFGQGATVLFPPAVTQQGNFLPFAAIQFCTTPTTVNTLGACQTPVTVYKDQALTQPYSSAILTDGIGYFPPNANTATSLWFTPTANLCFTLTTSNMLSPATNPCTPFSVAVTPGSSPTFTNLTVSTLAVIGNGAGGIGNSTAGGGINLVKASSPAAIFMQRLIDSFGNTNAQLIGFNIEQEVNPTSSVAYSNFGQTTEWFTPTTNSQPFTAQQTAVYGSFNHFGSGNFTGNGAGTGASFEAFNDGPATMLLLAGVTADATNGGVAAGVPIQTPTNNGVATNLRGVDAFVRNLSSGTVTTASAFFAETPVNSGGGSITNAIGVNVADQTAGVSNFAIKTGLGLVSFGDATTVNSTLRTTGNVGIGGSAPLAAIGVAVNPTGLTSTSQTGMFVFPSTTSAATVQGTGIQTRADVAASTTQALNVGIDIAAPTINGGGVITKWDGLRIEKAPTAGTQCSLDVAGSTSGLTCINVAAVASGTITYPAATGTVALDSAQTCGTTTTCSATNVVGLKTAYGSAPLVSGTPSVATVTGISPAFTSSSSFVCTATNATTQANPIKVVNASSSSITLTGPNTVTDTVNYICVGT